LLAVSQLGLAVLVDRTAVLRDPEYEVLERTLQERIAEEPERPVALFVGSSRIANGFDARRATGSHEVLLFNYGVPGSGPFFQSVILDRLHQAGVKPDILFLELLHPFYNAAGPRSMDHGLLDGARLSAAEAGDLANYGTRSRTGPLRRWAYARAMPAYRHSSEIRDSLGLGVYPNGCETCTRMDSLGYRPKQAPPGEWASLTAIAHENYDPFYPNFQLDLAPWQRLLQTIAKAREQGTHVVVVLMPEGSTFRSLSSAQSELARAEMMRCLREERGVAVIDARAWLDDPAFYDQHHLLPAGADAFADRFRDEVLRPTLAVKIAHRSLSR
jgi:hypothetical protein